MAEADPPYPEDSGVEQETGVPGEDPDGLQTWQPQKKPTGQERTPAQHEPNSLLSSIRMVREPRMGGMKRGRIVKALFRNTKETYDDLVLEIACALHNFRVSCRQSSKLICDNVY